ncbi:MAG: RNA 2',3'-cyclic phosphodiesterase [Gammaproteobacteria bacterium]|nr:MAG: RNA 2',3'-cyclic phosphodiesterase [Gammaproteobacteria bacterium]
MTDTAKELRCFIGIPVPSELANRLKKQVKDWRDSNEFPDYKWVKKQDYHLTLHFIGELRPAKVQKLIEKLKSAPIGKPGKSIKCKSVIGFPTKEKAKFLAAECELTKELQLIHSQTGQILQELGLPVENKPFRPHISLGRLKPKHQSPVIEEIARLNGEYEFSDIAVFRSMLTPEGSHYEVMAKIN